MKFPWPKNATELRRINKQQLGWLLSGLRIEQKNSFKEIEIDLENTANYRHQDNSADFWSYL